MQNSKLDLAKVPRARSGTRVFLSYFCASCDIASGTCVNAGSPSSSSDAASWVSPAGRNHRAAIDAPLGVALMSSKAFQPFSCLPYLIFCPSVSIEALLTAPRQQCCFAFIYFFNLFPFRPVLKQSTVSVESEALLLQAAVKPRGHRFRPQQRLFYPSLSNQTRPPGRPLNSQTNCLRWPSWWLNSSKTIIHFNFGTLKLNPSGKTDKTIRRED